ncbi:hypothetical protein [Synechococcus sp. LTW-G]
MTRSASLLAALALTSGAALNLSTGAAAMTIAWDCFDRTSNALVARSAVDLTSPAISCLQAAGAGNNQAQNEPTEQSADLATNDITGDSSDPGATEFSDDFTADAGAADPGYSEDPSVQDDTSAGSGFANAGSSTGDALGQAVGSHLGKLLGQGISDLFGRR